MDISTYLVYTLTSAIVIFSPGPTAILMASQGASNGLRSSLIGVLGVTCATLLYYVMSATGIASLIVASHTLFQIIKWVGVAYLLYLGFLALFSKSGGLVVKSRTPARQRKALFAHGFLVEFSNPKALLFFSAILPQFLDINRLIAPQFVIMWATSFILQWCIYSSYAYLGASIIQNGVKPKFVNAINKTAGAALIFAGMKMASVTANR